MSSPDQNHDFEVRQLIDAVLAAFAKKNFPAVAVLPSDDLADSKAVLAQLCRLEIGIDPRQRPN